MRWISLRSFSTSAKQGSYLGTAVKLAEEKVSDIQGLPIIHHPGYVCDLPPKHRFPMPKFHGVLNHLIKDGVVQPSKQVRKPKRVEPSHASIVHTKEYVDKFFNGRTSEAEQRKTGFKWSPGLVSRVRYETGGTMLAAVLCLEHGLACSTAGGTHHAFPDYGSGYCLLNDLAVAATFLINQGLVSRILIVDLDVHQGDGTAAMFEGNSSVFTFSMHCGDNFPLKKERSDLDLSLPKGTGDDEYLQALKDHLPWIIATFKPDMTFFDAGVDPHKEDELGKLCLTDQGLYARDKYVLETMRKNAIPCACVIGGGYDKDLDNLAKRHTIVHRAASCVFQDIT
ncbi:unnamed protein product [Darwinula stevensoni]|uniref:Histone deacetylase domain-containing protein n=1 Tax=Darwinula stevensoni TaxID=69355 RepID=A0A7R9AD77_9CRUS|nr:unnamed protein product [Darwinula stevensoni]CAG0901051.1 unnamed protein product [Darwinula stevensoni]